MKRFIGGLLVISILAGTASAAQRRVFSYSPAIPQIITTIRKNEDDEEIINLEAMIRKALNDIDINKRTISQLLKEKVKLSTRFSARLDLFAYYKAKFSNSQINEFSKYMSSYEREGKKLDKAMGHMESPNELEVVKKELYSMDSDKGLVYEKLRRFVERQLETIKYLKNMIFMTNRALAFV